MPYEFWFIIGTRAKKMFFVKEVRSKHPMKYHSYEPNDMFQPDCRATQSQVIWILKLAQEMRLSLVSFTFRSSVYPTLPESYIIIHVTTRTPTLLTFHFHNVLALSQLEAAKEISCSILHPPLLRHPLLIPAFPVLSYILSSEHHFPCKCVHISTLRPVKSLEKQSSI